MSITSLALYVSDNRVNLKHDKLIEALSSVGLTGKSIGPFQFLAGERFFKLITFVGCSPNISLSPEQSDKYLKIHIPLLMAPALFIGARACTPLCPGCKQLLPR